MTTDGTISIVVQLTAKEGREQDLLEAMKALVPDTTAEEGCERFELLQCRDDPRILTFLERFRDEKAFGAHASAAYVKDFLEKRAPNLVEDNHTVFYNRIA